MLASIAVVRWDENHFLGIKCVKGRGLILPGGKYEEYDGDHHTTASRELYEETKFRVDPRYFRFAYYGPDGFGFNVFAFTTHSKPPYYSLGTITDAGTVTKVTWHDLFQSKYRAYYRCLRDVLRD